LEYVVRRFPDGDVPRLLVRLRELPSRRPATEPIALTGAFDRAVVAELAREPQKRWPTAAPSAPNVLDVSSWTQLRELAGTDSTFLPSLVNTFLLEGQRLVDRLEVEAGRGDALALARTAHSLKSSSAQVGALALSRHCKELEGQGAAGNLLEMRAAVLRISQEFPGVADALRALGQNS
jgi:HPt (histidine-containing phosphotransfer) domain-containing protein